jgi:hypothetical protein
MSPTTDGCPASAGARTTPAAVSQSARMRTPGIASASSSSCAVVSVFASMTVR